MSVLETLEKIVRNNFSDFWRLSAAVISFIKESDEQEQLNIFITFLKEFNVSEYDSAKLNEQYNLSDEHYSYFMDISRTVERILQNLINSNVKEAQFYEALWTKFNDPVLFPNDDDKTALLLGLWLNVRIPYYQLAEGCIMENDEYEKLAKSMREELKKANFIIYSGIPQKTQRTSLLMDLADTITDTRKRTVFWSVVISIISQREASILVSEHDQTKSSEL